MQRPSFCHTPPCTLPYPALLHARTCAQVMSDSQVSGGCWSQLPLKAIDESAQAAQGARGLYPMLGDEDKWIWMSIEHDSREVRGTAHYKYVRMHACGGCGAAGQGAAFVCVWGGGAWRGV